MVAPSRGLYRSVTPCFGFMQGAIKHILEHPFACEWTVQGFGMIRAYFGERDRWRLNVWDSSVAVPGVSTVHNHPWNFRSWIIAGKFTNVRYRLGTTQDSGYRVSAAPPNYHCQTIKTRDDCVVTGVEDVFLQALQPEVYEPGECYAQSATEIHESHFEDGTVTLNSRTERQGEEALVFWPIGQSWVDAKPRRATYLEVAIITARALDKWFAK